MPDRELVRNVLGITDRGIDDLKVMKGLHELYLGSTRMSDAGIQRLQAALPELRIIH